MYRVRIPGGRMTLAGVAGVLSPGQRRCALNTCSPGTTWCSGIQGGLFVPVVSSAPDHLCTAVSTWGWSMHWFWDGCLSADSTELRTFGDKKHSLLVLLGLGWHSLSHPIDTASQARPLMKILLPQPRDTGLLNKRTQISYILLSTTHRWDSWQKGLGLFDLG